MNRADHDTGYEPGVSTDLPDPLIPGSSLVVVEGGTQNVALVILVSELSEGSPPTSDAETTIGRL